MNKLVSPSEAIDKIKDNYVLASSGFRWIGSPELLLSTLGSKFCKENSPSDLTLIFSSAQGDSISNGLENLAHKGLLKRVIGGFWGINPKLYSLAKQNYIQAYNFPQGVITKLYSSIASKSPGLLTKTGIGTYIDPRKEAGKLNKVSREDLIKVVKIFDEEYLLYKSMNIDIAFIRGSIADYNGNVAIVKEAAKLEILPLAIATHNSGGKVIVQVEKFSREKLIDAKKIAVPGYLIDSVVLSVEAKNDHRQSCTNVYEPKFSGNLNEKSRYVPVIPKTNKLERSIIAERALKEIQDGDIINLGQGIPTDIIPLLEKSNHLKISILL